MDELYSIENAQKFNWSSVTGNLNPERVSHLETYLVGNKILDAGCSAGAYVEFLAKKGLEVTGVDKYEQFLAIARERTLGTYVKGDITKLPFSNKTFDCTYCFDILEHVDDQLAIQELARVTAKRLIITVPKQDEIMHKFNLTFLHYQDKSHIRNYTKECLKELLVKIDCSKVYIFEELVVPMKELVKEMINFNFKNFSTDKIVYTMLRMKLKEILSFHNSSWQSLYQKSCDSLKNRFLDEALYNDIYTGLVAVVDLAPLEEKYEN